MVQRPYIYTHIIKATFSHILTTTKKVDTDILDGPNKLSKILKNRKDLRFQ